MEAHWSTYLKRFILIYYYRKWHSNTISRRYSPASETEAPQTDTKDTAKRCS